MEKLAKSLLLLILGCIMLLPIVQQLTGFFPNTKLYGAIKLEPNPDFSWKSWWNGSFQEQKNKYLNDNMGFRPLLVKINNQVDYTIARKLHAKDVVIGKEHCLYEKGYINAYYGRDYVGEKELSEKVFKLKKIQDTLERLGKTVILVLAPSKARYYSEYIPDSLKGVSTKLSNYVILKEKVKESKINCIDVNEWYCSMKANAPGLLMSKQGIHWTMYGAMLAADSLSHKIELMRDVKLCRLQIEKMNYSVKTNQDQERDLFLGLNLLFNITQEKYNCPQYKFKGDATSIQPKGIFIGDSFLWTWVYLDYFNQVYKDWNFWYYYHDVWQKGINKQTSIQEIDWIKILLNSDVIVIVNTEVNLTNLGNGFIEAAYGHFYK